MSSREPFVRLYNQGMILGPDSQKMSKSLGNVINPDDVIEEYGADCLRMYEMFMGPFEGSKPWSTGSIRGVYRFLERIYKMTLAIQTSDQRQGQNPEVKSSLHLLIKSIDQKIPLLELNTCVSDFMKFLNQWEDRIYSEDAKIMLRLMFPFTPILSCECLEILGEKHFLQDYYGGKNMWPVFDSDLIQGNQKVKIKVMINNRFRGEIENTDQTKSETEIVDEIRLNPDFTKYLPEKISKVVYIPGKLLNIV